MIMNNNLFKTLFIPAVACLLGACTESTGPDMEAGDDSLAIRFAGPAVTRAAIDDGRIEEASKRGSFFMSSCDPSIAPDSRLLSTGITG